MAAALRPFRLPAFGHLATAYLVNELGNWLGEIALALLIFDFTVSPIATAGLFLSIQFVPALAAPPPVARRRAGGGLGVTGGARRRRRILPRGRGVAGIRPGSPAHRGRGRLVDRAAPPRRRVRPRAPSPARAPCRTGARLRLLRRRPPD